MTRLEHDGTPGGTPRQTLTAEDFRALRRLFVEGYSAGRLQVVEDLVAPGFEGFCTGNDDVYRGPDGVRAHIVRLRSAILGLDVTIDDVRGSPDGVEVRWTASGRLERPVMGVQPACVIGRAGEEPGGPDIRVTGRARVVTTDGVVQETHMEWDLEALRAQVGPSPAVGRQGPSARGLPDEVRRDES